MSGVFVYCTVKYASKILRNAEPTISNIQIESHMFLGR